MRTSKPKEGHGALIMGCSGAPRALATVVRGEHAWEGGVRFTHFCYSIANSAA